MCSAWRQLDLRDSHESIPPICLKYEISAAEYSVWLTDLTFIWVETIDRKSIIQRSFSIDTSIDPSEGSDQFRLLLKSIEDAFEQRQGTTLDVIQNDRNGKLTLRTRTPLPGSLKPLEWLAELTLAPQSRFTIELVVPLLSQHLIATVEKASMLQHLREKDQIIDKLMDKMQSDGTDLGRVFPGLTSNKAGKQISRQTLGKSVRGLGKFDEQQWLDRAIKESTSSKDYLSLVSDAFQNGLSDLSGQVQIPEHNRWWETLGNKTSERKPDHGSAAKGEISSQNDFQVRRFLWRLTRMF